MNFQNMEYFIEVVSEKSITRAAEHLGVSQQAVSSHIARLEDELGCALFERYQNLTLTYSGRQFYQSCIKMLDIKRQMTTEINDIENNKMGELRIGISFTRGQAILPIVLPSFTQMYPNVELKLTEGSTKVLEDRLSNGLIDVMIGYSPFMIECAQSYPLMKDRLYLIIPNTLIRRRFGNKTDSVLWQFRQSSDLTLFKDIPFVLLKEGDRIRTIVDNQFRKARMKPFIKLETESAQTAYSLSTQGMGISICPQLYLESPYVLSGFGDSKQSQNVTCIPLFNDKTSDTIAIGYNKDRYLSKIAKDFITICQNTLLLEFSTSEANTSVT